LQHDGSPALKHRPIRRTTNAENVTLCYVHAARKFAPFHTFF